MITIAVLEDNLLLSDRMVSILRGWDQVYSVCAFASNQAFCAHASAETVDILLADLNVEDGSGVESIAYLSKAQPESMSIVISALSDSESIVSAISSGAVGYLHKDDSSFEIVASIKTALAGESPISPAIARKLVGRLHSSAAPEKPCGAPVERTGQQILTAREIEVLNLIAKGLSYSECAAVLAISEQTVPVHVRNIYRKLHAKNRSEAVYEARFLGVIT
ncbi:LuxR C-terminal-related transcriptional regulator [Roseicyclus mahoneyensis]|jgi:DNA-binding NarL/FixJ family response regulator|uniref:LuxR family two component transcriptional regulator n=1 Tax=Roseicyclus mahoneyensis TaxID=164332 RepID=A0A316GR18_9RHOB|nr:response regulator transcription factor [Roseicyclus mahoneyensis]PWK62046.1 LuxR family two component transcriptional regulator [Roseicyclus mahoneyensis]